MGGMQREVRGPACAVHILGGLRIWEPSRGHSSALPGAPGLGRDPPTPPRFPAAPPSPDEVCGDRRSGPWKNTMEGPHKGGFIQICLEFSGFA